MKKYLRSVWAAVSAIAILTASMSVSFVSATPGVDEPPVSCMDNHESWPTSNSWKQSEWDMSFLGSPSSSTTLTPFSNFVDINGDGLADYVYSQTRWNAPSERKTCVHLNNGTGWDLVYKCFAHKVSGVWTFWGDCADV